MNHDPLKTAVAAANAEWARAERYRLAWLSARRRATLAKFGYLDAPAHMQHRED